MAADHFTSSRQMNCSADDSAPGSTNSIITTASSILVSSMTIDSSSSPKPINNLSTLLIEPLITNGRNAVAELMLEAEKSSVDIGIHSWWRYNAYVSAAMVVAYGLVFMAGIVGNLLVVFTVQRDSRMVPRCCVTNLFLVNLAAADLLVCMACIPFTLVAHLFNPWVLGSVICKLVPYLQGVSVAASVYTLVAVAVERHRSISFPWKRRLSSSCGRWIILFIWLFAFIITLPWLFVFNQGLSPEGVVVCTELWPNPVMGDIYFAVAHLTLCFLLPLAVIGACYALVCRRIWCRKIPGNEPQQPESQNNINSQQSPEQQQTHQPGNHKVHHHYRGGQQPQQRAFVLHRARLRALRMLLAVVAAFALAWLPLYLTFTRIKFATNMSEEESEFWKVVIPIAQWLGSANSCVNPVLYHFLDPRFRAGFRQLLCNGSSGNGGRMYQTRQSPSHQLANGIHQPNLAIGTAGAQQLLQSSNGRLRPPIQITFQQPTVRGDHNNSRADGASGSSGSSSNNNRRRQPYQEMELKLLSVNSQKNSIQSGSAGNINNAGRHHSNHHSGHYYCRSTPFPRQNEEWI